MLATASVGAAVRVWLATPPPTSSDERTDPAGPLLYPVAINTNVTTDGKVVLQWSAEVEELPGFQSYTVFRDKAPYAELDGGISR